MKSALAPALLTAFLMAACQASALVLDAKLPSPNQGFYGLDSQSGPATYTFTLPENASYLFAGILVKEGTASMELQDSSGYSYAAGVDNAIVDDAKPGTYTLTVTGTGKYTIFWDYMRAEKPAGPVPIPANWITLTQIGNSAFFGYDPGVLGGSTFPVAAGQTYNFLLDPSLATPLGLNGNPALIVGDIQQGYCGLATMYRVNPDNSLGSTIQATSGGNGQSEFWLGNIKLIPEGWHGEKLLLQFDSDVGCQLLIYWFMN